MKQYAVTMSPKQAGPKYEETFPAFAAVVEATSRAEAIRIAGRHWEFQPTSDYDKPRARLLTPLTAGNRDGTILYL